MEPTSIEYESRTTEREALGASNESAWGLIAGLATAAAALWWLWKPSPVPAVVLALAGVAALVLGTIGMAKVRRRVAGGLAASGLAILFGLGAPAYVVLAVAIDRSVARAYAREERRQCQQRLATLHAACLQHAAASNGRFPTFDELLASPAGVILICPSVDHSAALAPGPTSRPKLVADYIYLGRDLTTASPPRAVLAFEPPGNHEGGLHVLYLDGTIRYLEGDAAAAFLTSQPIAFPSQ